MKNMSFDQEKLEPLFELADNMLRTTNQSQSIKLTHYGYFEFVDDIVGYTPTPRCSQNRLTDLACHSLFDNLAR